jgi:phosphoglycolate phosphatase
VIFDMDGVLVFSEDAWFLVYNDTLVHFGHQPVSRAAFDLIYGNGTEADRDTYMPERTVEEVDEAYRRFFEDHVDAIRPNGEALAALRALSSAGLRVAVATNTNRLLAGRILELVGLLPSLDRDLVVGADEVGVGKPDPAILHLVSARMGIPLSEAIFVGDSRYDEEASRAAPVRFIGYRFGRGDRVESMVELIERLVSTHSANDSAG